MKKTKEEKITTQTQFNPRIIVGIIGSADLETLHQLKTFFDALSGFSLVYMRTSGSSLYITDKKPEEGD